MKPRLPRLLVLEIALLSPGLALPLHAQTAAPARPDTKAQPPAQAKTPATTQTPTPAKTPAPTPAQPPAPKAIESQPYKIVFSLNCLPDSRVDETGRLVLLRDWQGLVKRFVGPPWIVAVEPAASQLALVDPATAQAQQFARWSNYDKIWVVRLTRNEEGRLVFIGREYDVAARRMGSLLERPCDDLDDAPRTLLSFTLDLFSPTAVLTRQEAGRAILNVRGAALEAASNIGRVVSKGTVFIPLRLVSQLKGGVSILRIPFTYLQVESVEGSTARCTITSALSDPFTRRISRPSSIAAIGIKPGRSPIRLRFTTRPDGDPAAGYTLTAHLPGHSDSHELGSTDRSGRIVVHPGFGDSLMVLRLIAGRVEPLVEFPIMPGESNDERTIPVDPLPLTIALEARVDALRDQVVDLVALRARLEARMKARLEGEDWDGIEEALKEFQTLTPRDTFVDTLGKLKEEAQKQQAETRRPVLTRTAQAELADLQAMIDRYLDDEMPKAYADAVERGRAAKAAAAKSASKRGSAAMRNQASSPPQAARPAPQPAAQPAARPTAPGSRPSPPPARPVPKADPNTPF